MSIKKWSKYISRSICQLGSFFVLKNNTLYPARICVCCQLLYCLSWNGSVKCKFSSKNQSLSCHNLCILCTSHWAALLCMLSICCLSWKGKTSFHIINFYPAIICVYHIVMTTLCMLWSTLGCLSWKARFTETVFSSRLRNGWCS